MRSKLVALGALIIVFAAFEYVFYPRSIAPADAESLIPRLLPAAIGGFRSGRRWQKSDLGSHTLAVGASYRDATGVEANIDIWLGARAPHNGIACWFAKDYPVFWQRLREVRTTDTSAVFDEALFREDRGMVLLATTECYPTGCRESLVDHGELPPEGFGLRLAVFFAPAAVAAPISVLVKELNDPPGEDQKVQGARLMQGFERFAARLDLSPLLASAIAHSAKRAQPAPESRR